MSAAFFLLVAASASAHQPGLSRLDKQGAAALKGGGGAMLVTPPAYREGEVLVKLKGHAVGRTDKEIATGLGAEKARKLHTDKTVPGLFKLKLKAGDTVEKKIKELKSNPDVEYVQPNYIYRVQATPSDTLFKQQWDMNNTAQTVEGVVGKAGADMKMPAAWSISTGSKDIVVAVVDTGIDYYSPDLAGNLWTNPSPGSYDSTNYPNDIHGINPIAFDNYSGNPYKDPDDPYDDNGHGSHVSGTIGAKGNNAAGVAGINWDVSIMALKGLDFGGGGTDSDLIQCIDYAAFEKQLYDSNHNDGANVRVMNASWGGPPNSSDAALESAILQAGTYDILFVAAAGNSGTDNGVFPLSPASFATPDNNIIAVAATDNKDNLAFFSNYGSSVAVAAPGVDILSTLPVGQVVGGYFDNFEHGMHWQTGGINNTWNLTTESFYSPTHSLTDSPGVFYKTNTDSYAIWGPFDLSAETGPLKLEYRLKLDTEFNYDGVLVDETADGGNTWYAVDGFTGTTPGYEYFTTDISFLAGSSDAYIAFELLTNSSVNKDGVHIDDVAVTRRPTSVQAAGTYWYDSGTSMAAPHVTGLAALVAAANPALTYSAIKADIIGSVDLLPSLSGKVSSGGRVNGMKALAAAVGDGLVLNVNQSGGYTIMTARFIYGGSLQYGKSIQFYQDDVLKGTVLTGAYTSATPGIATLKFIGTATPNPHSAKAVSVAATGVPSQTSNIVSYTTFPPTIDLVSPSSAAVGSIVTLTGSWFSPTKGTVYLTNVTGSPVTTAIVPLTWTDNGSMGGSTITFKVPARVAGDYTLTVKNFAMTSATVAFTIPPPVVTGFSINGSSVTGAAPGITVTINGTGFGPVTGSLSLQNTLTNAVTAVTPLSWTDTAITFNTPNLKCYLYQLTVKNAAATSAQAPFAIKLAAIFSLLPSSTAAPGNIVTINGANFGLVKDSILLSVTNNGVTSTYTATPLTWTDTSVAFKVPGIKAATYDLFVKNAFGQGPTTPFTVPVPAITGLDQPSAAPGVTVTINGTGFGLTQGTLSLKSNSTNVVTAVAPVTGSWKDTSIQFKVPGLKSDSYQLTVKNAAGSVSQILIIPPPAVTGISPSSAAAGIPVSINGAGFGMTTGTISMKAGATVTAVTPKTWGDTVVTFITPPKPFGDYSITVGNAAGKSTPAGAITTFNVPLPAITTLSQDTAGPGIPVTINGTGFGLTKGSVLLTTTSGTITTTTVTPTVWGDSSIIFTVPSLAAKTYNLAVKNTAGTSVPTTFNIPLPDPASVSPTSAKAGTTGVTISGSDFGATKGSVLFKTTAGALAATVTPTYWSDGSIKFTVPAIAAKAYNVSVKDAAGTSDPTYPPLSFTITP